MHSILIIGCGSIGERHLRCFQRTGRARVAACDANPARLEAIARQYQAATFSDWELALERSGCDAAVICTPAHLHVAMATRALRRRCHVLIEKPLSQSLDGLGELFEASERSGRTAAVAYIYQVFPFAEQARDFLLRGEFGKVKHVSWSSGQNFPSLRPAQAAPYFQTYYRDRKTGGGAIQDALTHAANWVESVVGPTDSVLCDCAHQVVPEVTVEDTVNVCARHGDVLVSYALNQFQAPNEAVLQLNAAMGSVRIEFHRQRWGAFRLGAGDWTWHDAPVADRDGHFVAQAHRFIDRIEGRPARLCSLEAGRQTLRFNLAALASAEAGGRRVSCDALT